MKMPLSILIVVMPHVALADEVAGDPCTKSHNVAEVQCLGKKIEAAEKELDQLLSATLATLPDSDSNDIRKGKAQLRKAQNAWRSYRDENCQFIGGLQGGSNLWVTHFAADCMLDETKKRIEFFNRLPQGG
jgi:uncharacterized protein YecT (DUF1311 family)